MVEGDRRGLSYDECRRDLQLREQGWHELRWRKKIDIELPNFASMRPWFELVGRVFYVFDSNQSYTSQRAARVVLPAVGDEDQARWQPIWETLELGCEANRALMDVSQDILVLVEEQRNQ